MLSGTSGGGGGGGPTPYLYYKRATGLYTDAGSTPATSNGDLIYQWSDDSGNGRHATQPTSGSRMTLSTGTQYLSQNTVRAQAGTHLILPDLSGITTSAEVFVVVKTDNDPEPSDINKTGLWNLGTNIFATHFPYLDTNFFDDCGCTTRQTISHPGIDYSTGFHEYSVRSATSDWQNYFDNVAGSITGGTGGSVAFPAVPTLGISKGNPYNLYGWIAAFAIYSPSLTSLQRAAVYTMLTT
jgi:hypothetical protein